MKNKFLAILIIMFGVSSFVFFNAKAIEISPEELNALLGQVNLGAFRVCIIEQGCTGTSTLPSLGYILVGNSSGGYDYVATSTLGGGTVTSVAMTVPTGLAISGSPITTAGTLALALDTGYIIPLNASTTNWNNFYDTPSNRITDGTGLTWSTNTLNCDTASGSVFGCLSAADWTTFNNKWDLASSTIDDAYITSASTWNSKQAGDATLTALAAYNTNGLLVQTAADTFTGRSMATSSDRIIILNQDGVSGNPTFDLRDSAITSLSSLATVGTLSGGTLALGSLSFTGTLPHEYGGIEADISAITTGGLLRGTGSGTMGILALGTGGQLLGSTGGQIGYIGTSTMPLAGDVGGTLGATTISADSVDTTMIDWGLTQGMFKTRIGGYATSTWTGTTTVMIAPAPFALTVLSARCETDTGTVNASLYDGTNRANLINASTTIGNFMFTTNNTFNAGESMRVDFGTPASTPKQVSCGFNYIPQ